MASNSLPYAAAAWSALALDSPAADTGVFLIANSANLVLQHGSAPSVEAPAAAVSAPASPVAVRTVGPASRTATTGFQDPKMCWAPARPARAPAAAPAPAAAAVK
jgi:hypothetical protein